ncbi:MAG TPA: (2Fe-2S) ferredoxin domain-containing protein [Oscillatoriaceae cyanobacterium]
MPKPEHHIFVCQNERAADNPRGCCKARGSEEVLAAFKSEIRERGIRGRIEFDGSTCMDTCAWGPTVVVYPDNVWYGRVTPADVPEIVEAIAHGCVVERLRVPDEAIRKS